MRLAARLFASICLMLDFSVSAEDGILLGHYPWNTRGATRGYCIAGKTVYLTTALGLLALDLTEPSQPKEIAFLPSPGSQDVVASGGMLYVSDYSLGLRIFDISNASTLKEVGCLTTLSSGASTAVVQGNLAYIAQGRSCIGWKGLQIADIADPSHPVALGSLQIQETLNTGPEGLFVTNGIAYLATVGGGLWIVDVSNPNQPILKSTFATKGVAFSVHIVGHLAYVSGDSFEIVDVSDPLHPASVNHIEKSFYTSHNVAVAGTNAFLTDTYTGRIARYNISNPAKPVLAASFNGPYQRFGTLLVAGDLLFANSDGNEEANGLFWYSLNETNALKCGEFKTKGTTRSLAVYGDYLYSAENYEGLRIFNLQNPAEPALVNSLPAIIGVHEVSIIDNLLCLLDDGYFLVFSLEDPIHPKRVFMAGVGSAWDGSGFEGYYGSIENRGSLAYVGAGNTFRIFDLADASHINELSSPGYSWEPPATIRHVSAVGTMAAVCLPDRIDFVDCANPAHPQWVYSYRDLNYPQFTINTPGGLFVTGYRQTMERVAQLLDISQPTNPVVTASYQFKYGTGTMRGVLQDSILFLSQGSDGVAVFDVGNRTNLTCFQQFDDSSTTPYHYYGTDVALAQDHILVAANDAGMMIYYNNWTALPKIRQQPHPRASGRAGSPLLLEIDYSGMSAGTTWFKDGKPLPISERFSLINHSVLWIKSLSMEDAGRYFCRVHNQHGSIDSTPVTVTVEANDSIAPVENHNDGTPSSLAEEIRWRLNQGRYDPMRQNYYWGTRVTPPNPGGPLSPNLLLAEAARKHSEDMSATRSLQHDTLPQSQYYDPKQVGSFSDRITSEGYRAQKSAENIAAIPYDTGIENLGSLVYKGWWQSTGHRLAMFTTDLREVGIGIGRVPGASGSSFTMDLASRAQMRFFTDTFFEDDNHNGVYNRGEGRSGIKIWYRGPNNEVSQYFDVSTFSGGFSVPIETSFLNKTVSVIIQNENSNPTQVSLPTRTGTSLDIRLLPGEMLQLGVLQLSDQEINAGLRDVVDHGLFSLNSFRLTLSSTSQHWSLRFQVPSGWQARLLRSSDLIEWKSDPSVYPQGLNEIPVTLTSHSEFLRVMLSRTQ